MGDNENLVMIRKVVKMEDSIPNLTVYVVVSVVTNLFSKVFPTWFVLKITCLGCRANNIELLVSSIHSSLCCNIFCGLLFITQKWMCMVSAISLKFSITFAANRL